MPAAQKQKFPSLDQVRELPVQLTMTIPPEWEDRNGHVNVQYYLALYERGGWAVLEEVGIDAAWFRRHQLSMFDLEHHLHYLAEIRVGDIVTTYNRVLGFSDKRFHGLYLVVNETRERLAGVLEYITACVDMRARKIAHFPENLGVGIRELYQKHDLLTWSAPLCGALNL